MRTIGRYELLSQLASGNTGYVFSACLMDDPGRSVGWSRKKHGTEDATHAVKLIKPRLAQDARYAQLLRTEAPSAIAFRHPQAARIVEIAHAGSDVFIAMELVRGQTLATVLQRATADRRLLSREVSLWIARQVARVLAAAHETPWHAGEELGMLHGEISPQSILITYEGAVLLLGVGVGRSRLCLPPARSRLPYRAPELFERKRGEAGVDIYGLGVVLYDALSGMRVFARDSVQETTQAVLEHQVRPLRMIVPDTGLRVSELVNAMMALSPQDRPRTMDEVEQSLSGEITQPDAFFQGTLAQEMRRLFAEEMVDLPWVEFTPGFLDAHSMSMSPEDSMRTEPDGHSAWRIAPARELGPEPSPTPIPPQPTSSPSVAPVAGPNGGAAAPPRSVDEFDVDSLVDAIVAASSSSSRTESREFPREPARTDSREFPREPARTDSREFPREPARTDSREFPRPPPKAPAPIASPSESGGVRLPPKTPVPIASPSESGGVRLPPHTPSPSDSGGIRLPPRAPTPVAQAGDPSSSVFARALDGATSETDVDALVDAIVHASAQARGAGARGALWGSAHEPEQAAEGGAPEVRSSPPTPAPPPPQRPIRTGEEKLIVKEAIQSGAIVDIAVDPRSKLKSPLTKAFEDTAPDPARIDAHRMVVPATVPDPPPPPAATRSKDPSAPTSQSEIAMLEPGEVIGGRYRVIEKLGVGGMAVVYRVEHTLLEKAMALKLLRPELSTVPYIVQRFHREARCVSQLDDPRIVRVTDFGRAENGSLFLVMELIEGEPLSMRMSEGKPMEPMEAMRVIEQVLLGLEHAHKNNVIHRDLKPDNIMLIDRGGDPLVKIVDFGIAKLATADGNLPGAGQLTQAGMVFGSPRYMSPEQASGDIVDGRTDIYAAGVIVYELLTGRRPFDGRSARAILSAALTQPPPPMNLTRPNRRAGKEIENVVMCALSKEKEQRYPTASALLEALRAAFAAQ